MDKKKIYMIVGLIIVIAAIVLLINMHNSAPVMDASSNGQGQQQAAPAEPSSVTIVVARKDIAKGTPIGPDMVKPKKVLSNELSSDSIENPDSVVGKLANADIIMGEQITTSKISMRPEQQQLSGKIPEGKRAMIIPTDKISSLEGMVKPGDKVDIVGVFPQPRQGADGKMYSETVIVSMFENVLVLAVGNNLNSRGGNNENYTSITFALSTEESSILMYALQLGQIRLLLRSPLDSGVTARTPINLSTVYEKLFSIDRAAQARAQQQQMEQMQEQGQSGSRNARKGPAIEVFTGGQNGEKNK